MTCFPLLRTQSPASHSSSPQSPPCQWLSHPILTWIFFIIAMIKQTNITQHLILQPCMTVHDHDNNHHNHRSCAICLPRVNLLRILLPGSNWKSMSLSAGFHLACRFVPRSWTSLQRVFPNVSTVHLICWGATLMEVMEHSRLLQCASSIALLCLLSDK